jgi:hypothetical protein
MSQHWQRTREGWGISGYVRAAPNIPARAMIQTAASSAGAVRRLSLSEVWLVDRGFMCSWGLEKRTVAGYTPTRGKINMDWHKKREIQPVTVKPARSRLMKFFCYFLFTKSSLSSYANGRGW